MNETNVHNHAWACAELGIFGKILSAATAREEEQKASNLNAQDPASTVVKAFVAMTTLDEKLCM